jgi:hypothetical protein
MGSTLKVYGDVSMNANADISGNLIIKGRIGMNTQGIPVTTLDISATDAIRIPVGNTTERPTSLLNDKKYEGSIRYNTTNSQFEGYGPGGAWGSLGGVINVAQTTKILAAEPNADSSNNQLTFYTDNAKRMVIDSTGDISMGYNLSVSGAATMSSTLTVDGKTTLSDDVSMNANVDISGNLVIKGNLSVFQTKATETINTTVNDYTLIVTEDISLNGTLISSKDISVNSITVGRGSGDISTNTVVGYQALDSNTEGSNNIAVGFYAGDSNTSGSRNTYIGSDTTTNDGTYNDSTAIGYGASITASNQIVLGRSSETVVVPGDISLNGTPYAPTASFGDESNQIATTKFVSNALTVGVDLTSDQTITGIKSFLNGIDISGSTISPGELIYQINQLGQTINGSNSDIRVSINQDGTIIAVGDYKYNSNQGRVQIYQYNSTTSTWAQLGEDIVGEAQYDYYGRSLSLSSDGFTVAIGASDAGDGLARGHVRVYQYSDNNNDGISTWNQVGTDIVGKIDYDYIGFSVSLSADGTIVAVGGAGGRVNGSTYKGVVRIYQYLSLSDWTKLGDDIVGENSTDYAGASDSGQSVSLSADGSIVAIGAYLNDGNGNNSGHVRVYQYDSNKIDPVTDQDSPTFGPVGWNRLGQDIDGENDTNYGTYSQSGFSVSLSADGFTVAVGGPYSSNNTGHVRVYHYSSSSWTQLGQDILGNGHNYLFGYSVSLSSDGLIVAIGERQATIQGNAYTGRVEIYRRDTTTTNGWTQVGNINGPVNNGYFGGSVSLSADGSTVAVGSSAVTTVVTYKINRVIPIEMNALNVTSINSLTVGRGGGNIDNNTAIGTDALSSNTTGYVNVANGYQALSSNTTGFNNTASGSKALYYNTTGYNNTATGYQSLYSHTTGSSNTAVGKATLYSNTTGLQNTAFGLHALYSNNANYNTGVGLSALYTNTTGSYNTAIGYSAGLYNNNASYNTFIGYNTDISPTTANWTNSTALGNGARITTSNEIVLGNSAIQYLRCADTAISGLSDARDKKNIQPLTNGIAFVDKLNPVKFDWNMRDGGKVDIPEMGFIAQELQQVQEETGITVPGLVRDNDPERLEAAYGKLLPILVKSIQDLSAKLTTSETKNAELETKNAEIEAKITELETKNADLQSQFNTVMAILSNNNLS